ncbi:hypothetical protein KBTX_01356 [wastewater metagenome]|uniref:DUF3135 domain-containing protein n=2 Tax=unclassified sequences TaxID=12908 RepID=A0A5B8RE73_9ZZZZ|nr:MULTISPECIES: DUF3135 domain-containing protein [Arhodomonas]MCS4505295.1 DUF3135 domain-containing protein [Arhodomonas aquaeolei]QEA05037.1 hypothetical protein KBTEX_01356 [uncultured organism]
MGGERFDFDEWAELARSRPEAFEHRRRAALEAAIMALPGRRTVRLRRLQWRIDRERERAANPVDACVRLHRMMWRSFAGPGGLTERLNALAGEPAPPRPPGRILPFPSRRR